MSVNKIKKFINQVKDLIEAHKHMRYTPLVSTEKVEDVHVYVSDEYCLGTAYLPKDVIGAFAAKNLFGLPVIIINKKCDALPEEFRNAIIQHELGHIKLGHLDNPSKLSLIKRDLEKEFEADMYAQQQGYNMVGVLEMMKTVYTDKKNLKEFDKRICNLSQG